MKPKSLCVVAAYALSIIGLTDGIGVFSLAAAPASLLIGLPFTVSGVTSGTLAALGALKLLAASALSLSYAGTGVGGSVGGAYGPGFGGGFDGGNSAFASGGFYGGGLGDGSFFKRSIGNKFGNLDLYFHIINEIDANSCALRLICELEASKAKDKLQDDERMILALFSAKPKEIPIEKLKTPSGPYEFAAFVGSSSSVEDCGKFYGKCPYNASRMMSALRAASQRQ